MARPNVPQGGLNRLRASVMIPKKPALNVTSFYLLPEAIDVAFEGQPTLQIPTLTGVVTSPEPYMMARIGIHIIRAQPFAELWRQQIEIDSTLDDITVRPDATPMSPYDILNASIVGVERFSLSGRDAGYTLMLGGYWPINSSLYDAA